uniref:Nicotinic acetylcholine receptor n=1 Tax=Polyphagotarsonemus latus TaxID=1204166 RepID=A0AAN0LHC3_9ACAR
MFFKLLYYNANCDCKVFSFQSSEDEERLVRDLFRDYNKLIRPVEMINMTVEVLFSMSLIQLINVNEKNQVMTTNVWLNLKWKDYQLKWDKADYGGISVLRLPADKVWKPDIVLFNNADGNYEVRFKCNVLIYNDGSIHWVPPAIYQSSCTIDVTYFPFDQQKCLMKFSSWTFNGDQVSLNFKDGGYVDLSDYWKSGSWDIVEAPASLNRYNNTKLGHPSETDITFHITIRRKTLFYTVNLILPTLLISFLCILVFYLPAEAGEKVTLGISILLSLVVFLLLVSKILPPTSLVLPLIAKYLLFTFIMNCISILVTVIIINYNFRGPRTHKMPAWTRIVFLHYLPILLFLRRPKQTRLKWMMDIPALSRNQNQSNIIEQNGMKNTKNNFESVNKKSTSNKSLNKNKKSFSKNNSLNKENSPSIELNVVNQLEENEDDNLEKINQVDCNLKAQLHSNVNNFSSLQQLNVSNLPNNVIHFPMHNHFNTLNTHSLFHSPISDSQNSNLNLMNSYHHHSLHHPPCYLTHRPQVQNLNLDSNQQIIPNFHSYSNDSQLIQSFVNPIDSTKTIFNPIKHHLNDPHIDSENLSEMPSSSQNCFANENNDLNINSLNFGIKTTENNETNYKKTIHSSCTNDADCYEKKKLNSQNKIENQNSCDSNNSSDSFYLSPAAFKATEAIEFIAEHLRNEDQYIQIREDWKFVAMVIDRLQLYIFFIVTVFGTISILLDAPHIFEVVNQDEVIKAHSGSS